MFEVFTKCKKKMSQGSYKKKFIFQTFILFSIYRSEFKSWEFGKKAAQIFCSGASSFVHEQRASEVKKFAAKLTQSKTNF
jgi:hypothetical protein